MSEQLAWAAGFFDGEGCIGVYPCKGTNRLLIQVSQVMREPLDYLVSLFGGSVLAKRPDKHQQLWSWQAAARTAANALALLRPYLRVKAGQADLALAFQSLVAPRRGARQLSQFELAERISFAEALREVKKALKEKHE